MQSSVNVQPGRLGGFLSCYPALCSAAHPLSAAWGWGAWNEFWRPKIWAWNVLKQNPQPDYSVSNPDHHFPVKMCCGIRKATGFSSWFPWYTKRWITWDIMEFLSKKVGFGFVWASSCPALWFWKEKFKAKCKRVKERSLWKDMSSLQATRISRLQSEVGEGWKDKICLSPSATPRDALLQHWFISCTLWICA